MLAGLSKLRNNSMTFVPIKHCFLNKKLQSQNESNVLQDNLAAAKDSAKDKMSSKGEKNKAGAQTSTYHTRSKAAAALNPDN